MSQDERQKQFEQAVKALPDITADAKIGTNFGFSNSARVLEGGLFAGTNNLETYSAKLAANQPERHKQLVLLCILTFPPHDEVYFAVSVEMEKLHKGLIKLFQQGTARNAERIKEKKSPGSISNNVKFYITEDGRLFFHNEGFKDSLSEARQKGELDPDCVVEIDAIHFAIWPPVASARRSLLARQFVGYLGTLIGRAKVHEIRVWDEAGSVSPGMRRMPPSIPVEEIETAVQALGGYYPGGEVRRIHAALNFLEHKHFVILSGLSGTGKTRLALRYARAVHQLKLGEPDPFLFACAVRPEWTDPTGLTGYIDPLSNRYIVPTFLEAVLLATAHRDSPVFVVLDEMNLARVEYYFSDVLSAVEIEEEPLRLHSSGVPLEGSTGTSVPSQLPLPRNLYLIGTINIDETANPVSDKVLDRAIVIDMSAVDLTGFIEDLRKREQALSDACTACAPHLKAAQDIMSAHGLAFGYRVIEEVIRYQAFAANHLKQDVSAAIDDLMVQKVLVKLRGADKQRSLLTGLMKALAQLPRSQSFLSRLLADLEEFGSFQASR